jgi:LmbE family N-acetylglucosaminyl deacetylase
MLSLVSRTGVARLVLLSLFASGALILTLVYTSGHASSRPATKPWYSEVDALQATSFDVPPAPPAPTTTPLPPSPTAAPPVPLQTTIYWLFAHPDDESLAAGAALRQAQIAGHRNVVVIFSSGEMTAVRKQLGLTRDQTVASRQAETVQSMAAIGVTDVRFLGIPEGQISIETVRRVIDEILATETGPLWFRGHSPYDHYLGLPCGHQDHCAIANALLQEYQEGRVKYVEFYRIGQLFGEAREGTCYALTADEKAAKARMRAAYAYNNWSQGRFGIGARSVPGAWAATATQPECEDVPR